LSSHPRNPPGRSKGGEQMLTRRLFGLSEFGQCRIITASAYVANTPRSQVLMCPADFSDLSFQWCGSLFNIKYTAFPEVTSLIHWITCVPSKLNQTQAYTHYSFFEWGLIFLDILYDSAVELDLKAANIEASPRFRHFLQSLTFNSSKSDTLYQVMETKCIDFPWIPCFIHLNNTPVGRWPHLLNPL
jgi:hypothetical protein